MISVHFLEITRYHRLQTIMGDCMAETGWHAHTRETSDKLSYASQRNVGDDAVELVGLADALRRR